MKKRPSYSWFLLPLFFGIIGGIVAYLSLRKKEKSMAKWCLIIGLIHPTYLIIFIGALLYYWTLTFVQEKMSEINETIPYTFSEIVPLELNHYYYIKVFAENENTILDVIANASGGISEFYILDPTNCKLFLNNKNFSYYYGGILFTQLNESYVLDIIGEWCITFFNNAKYNENPIVLSYFLRLY